MSEARWAQVKALFQAAVERPASERAAFLAAATGGDELLRREVESLLRSDDPDAALTNQLQAGVANVSAVSVGSRLGSYEILSALGAGGMGEVYRAATPGSIVTWRSRSCRRPSSPTRNA
jgi:serine/threonine-protein kinase